MRHKIAELENELAR